MTQDSSQSALAQARASELTRLREQFAFENTPASSYALAKSLWQNGLYDEAYAQFVTTRDRVPQAPDAGLALVRAALMLGRIDEARAALEHALVADPGWSPLRLHQAQLMADSDPASARDLLAGHRQDPTCSLFHDALDAQASGATATVRALHEPAAEAAWSGFAWLTAQTPRPRLFGTSPEVLRHALEQAQLDGLVLECGVLFGRSLSLLARWSGQRCHGFDSFLGAPAAAGGTADGTDSTAGVVPDVAGDVVLHPGWFKDTLPAFFAAQQQPVRLLHIDCGHAGSTRDVLDAARPWLQAGSVIVFGNFIGLPAGEQHEFAAFQDFAQEHGIRHQVLCGTLLGRDVALRIEHLDA